MLLASAIEQRFRHPIFAGALEASGSTLSGEASTAGSQAVLRIYLQLAGETIESARFQACGCPATIAAGDWTCEWLSGRELSDIRQLTAAKIEAALELPPEKRHVALLVEDALQELHAKKVIPNTVEPDKII